MARQHRPRLSVSSIFSALSTNVESSKNTPFYGQTQPPASGTSVWTEAEDDDAMLVNKTEFPQVDEISRIYTENEMSAGINKLQRDVTSLTSSIEKNIAKEIAAIQQRQLAIQQRVSHVDSLASLTLNITEKTISKHSSEAATLLKIEKLTKRTEVMYLKMKDISNLMSSIDQILQRRSGFEEIASTHTEGFPRIEARLHKRQPTSHNNPTLSISKGNEGSLEHQTWRMRETEARRLSDPIRKPPALQIRTLLPQSSRRVSGSAVPMRELDSASTVTSIASTTSRFSMFSWGRKSAPVETAEQRLRRMVATRRR